MYTHTNIYTIRLHTTTDSTTYEYTETLVATAVFVEEGDQLDGDEDVEQREQRRQRVPQLRRGTGEPGNPHGVMGGGPTVRVIRRTHALGAPATTEHAVGGAPDTNARDGRAALGPRSKGLTLARIGSGGHTWLHGGLTPPLTQALALPLPWGRIIGLSEKAAPKDTEEFNGRRHTDAGGDMGQQHHGGPEAEGEGDKVGVREEYAKQHAPERRRRDPRQITIVALHHGQRQPQRLRPRGPAEHVSRELVKAPDGA